MFDTALAPAVLNDYLSLPDATTSKHKPFFPDDFHRRSRTKLHVHPYMGTLVPELTRLKPKASYQTPESLSCHHFVTCSGHPSRCWPCSILLNLFDQDRHCCITRKDSPLARQYKFPLYSPLKYFDLNNQFLLINWIFSNDEVACSKSGWGFSPQFLGYHNLYEKYYFRWFSFIVNCMLSLNIFILLCILKQPYDVHFSWHFTKFFTNWRRADRYYRLKKAIYL
jgi:hypothetical protein